MNHLIQCAVSTRGNQQIHVACVRHKPPRISLFPSHSYFDAMPDFSLPNNCSPQCVISGCFPVENQLNFSTLYSRIHLVGNVVPRSVLFTAFEVARLLVGPNHIARLARVRS